MVCNEYIVCQRTETGRVVKGMIYADSMPATLPTDGTDIDGLSSKDTLAVGSILIAPSAKKMLFPGGWEDI